MNEIVVNVGDLEVNGLKVVQNMTKVSRMRLDESHNLPQMRLAKSHSPKVLRTDLGMGLGIRFVCKLAKSLIKTGNKVHKPKTYNKAINDLIHGNR